MEKIHPNAAGMDIGAAKNFVSVEGDEVQCFDTFTADLHRTRDYLLAKGVETVAMEATGSYWINLYDILDQAGIDVWLVDGRETSQVPGRKTDVKDCQWIRQLHSHGLLRKCFVPSAEIIEMRSYKRLREDHIRSASMHVNHMQKALIEMNIRLKQALSQVHGASGLAIIDGILEGQRDPKMLLASCHTSVRRNKATEVLKALEGNYSNAGLFALRQAREAYKFYQQQIAECDAQIAKALQKMNSYHEDKTTQERIKSVKGRKPIRHNKPNIENLGGHLIEMCGGVDATTLPGITDYSWLQILLETGTDLSRWPTEKHFSSWLGLSPKQNNSGKKKRNKKRGGKAIAGQTFRQVSQSVIESKKLALGAFGRRIKARRGPGTAVKATARKLATLYYRLMTKGGEYVERGIQDYEQRQAEHKLQWLIKSANKLGLQLIES